MDGVVPQSPPALPVCVCVKKMPIVKVMAGVANPLTGQGMANKNWFQPADFRIRPKSGIKNGR